MTEKDRGQVLMITFLIVVVLLIFIPVLTNLMKQEVQQGVTHRQYVTAFQLAEAAIDRGLWKLRESSDVWDSVADGTLDSDYTGGAEFSDIDGGKYKVTITTTSDEDERVITGIGKEDTTGKMRAIQVVVSKASISAAIYAPQLVLNGATEVHWGPIQSDSDMTCTGDLFPRKYAVGEINGRTPDGVGDPDTDGIEYWAHYPVPEPPDIDFDYYYDNADEYYGPDAHPNKMGGVPANFSGHAQDSHAGADRIYYVDGDLDSLRNTYLKGTLIVKENLRLRGGGKGEYTANVPAEAWKEYAKLDSAAANEYPGDNGFQQVSATYDLKPSNSVKISVEGFIYIGGNWWGNGNQDFHGCVQCEGSMANLTGNVRIYYDDSTASQVKTTASDFAQESWQEITPEW